MENRKEREEKKTKTIVGDTVTITADEDSFCPTTPSQLFTTPEAEEELLRRMEAEEAEEVEEPPMVIEDIENAKEDSPTEEAKPKEKQPPLPTLPKKVRKSATVYVAEMRDNTLYTIKLWGDAILALIEKSAIASATLSYMYQENSFFAIAVSIFIVSVIIKHIIPDSPLTKLLRNDAKKLHMDEKLKFERVEEGGKENVKN